VSTPDSIQMITTFIIIYLLNDKSTKHTQQLTLKSAPKEATKIKHNKNTAKVVNSVVKTGFFPKPVTGLQKPFFTSNQKAVKLRLPWQRRT